MTAAKITGFFYSHHHAKLQRCCQLTAAHAF